MTTKEQTLQEKIQKMELKTVKAVTELRGYK